MNTSVELRIHKPLDGESLEHGAVVEIRALGRDRPQRSLDRVTVPVGEDPSRTRHLDLAPGLYEFSATLPSGSVVSEVVDVRGETAAQPLRVTLDAGGSPHEWLAWQQWSGNVSERRSIDPLRASLKSASEPVQTALVEVTAELWRADPFDYSNYHDADPTWTALSNAFAGLRTGETIDPASLRPAGYVRESLALMRDPAYVATRLPLGIPQDPQRAYLIVRLSGRSMLCTMPWPWQQVDGGGEALVEAVVALEDALIGEDAPLFARTPNDPVWSVRPSVRDRAMGGLLAYFASGEQAAARELLLPARRLLFEKLLNPFAAAGGAYVLLADWIAASAHGGGDGEGSADWMRWVSNLGAWFPWLPDGAILEGWLALRIRDQEPRLEAARAALLLAERRGIPVYTAGVRLLVDGLILLSGEMRRRGSADPEIDAALVRARRLAWQVDPRQPFTCVRLWSS